MDADTPGSPPSPPRHLRNKPHVSRLPTGGPQEEVDQISSAYSNPPSARDPDDWNGPYAPHGGGEGREVGQKISKIPPIVAQVKSSSDPQRIITGAKSILGAKKFPSPVKQHDLLQSEYDDRPQGGHGHGHHLQQQQQMSVGGNGDFDLEESEDFHHKPKHRQLSNVASGGALLKKKPIAVGSPYSEDPEESSDRIGEGVRHMNKKPKAPTGAGGGALIFPSEGEGKSNASKAIQIRQSGLNQLNNGNNKVARVPQPTKGGRGVIQNEERWMEGGAGGGGGGGGSGSGESHHDSDSKYQPTTPRGQKSHHQRGGGGGGGGSYETKFDRDRLQHRPQPPPPQQQQQQLHHSNSSDDGLEVLDDISESYDSHPPYALGGGGAYASATDDDQSITSDISLEKGGGGNGLNSSPGQENHPRENQNTNSSSKIRFKKQKNSVLGKLNKQRLRSDPIEESYGGSGGLSNGPSLSDLQIGPAQVPPGMMIPTGGAAGAGGGLGAPVQAQQPRLVKQMKPVGLR
jgi:hypothetical protein